MADFIRNPVYEEMPRKPMKIKSPLEWKSSTSGLIMVNVDDSFLETSSSGGIRGVFKDSKGMVLLYFGKAVWANLTIQAEMLVLREGLFVAMTLRLASSHSFLFKFDSKLVTSWVNNFLSSP